MSIRNFLWIILKITGIIFLIMSVLQIPSLVFPIIIYDTDGSTFMIMLLPFIAYLIVSLFFLFGTDFIIQILKIDKGAEKLSLNFDSAFAKLITQISITLVGVYMFATSIPAVLIQFFYYVKRELGYQGDGVYVVDPISYQALGEAILTGVIGYLMITNRNRLTKWIDSINRKNTEIDVLDEQIK